MKRLLLMCVVILCLAPFAFADEVTFAPQGMYRVFCENGLYGIRTLDGETAVPARFEGIRPIRGDLCVVETRAGDDVCAGLWRLSTGEELLPCEYWDIELTDTMVITSDIWDPDMDGYSMCQLYDPDRRTFTVTAGAGHDCVWSVADGQFFSLYSWEDGTERLIAPDGTAILDMDLNVVDASPVSHGIVAVYGWFEEDGAGNYAQRCYNTVTGTWLEGSWKGGYEFADGYAAVWGSDRKWYVIDESGKQVTPGYQWIANEDDAVPYGCGLFSAKTDDGWHIIRVSSGAEPEDLWGPVQCSGYPGYLGNGVFALPAEEGTLVFDGLGGKQCFLEDTCVWDRYVSHSAEIESGGKFGFLLDDLSVIGPVYDGCAAFLGDWGFVKIDNTWHPVSRDGQVDTSISFSRVEVSYDECFYLVEYDRDHMLCLDPSLQPITCIISGFLHG